MSLRIYQVNFFLILFFVIICQVHPREPDNKSNNALQSDQGKDRGKYEQEFQEVEERLKKLKQLMEEQHKLQRTSAPPPQTPANNGQTTTSVSVESVPTQHSIEKYEKKKISDLELLDKSDPDSDVFDLDMKLSDFLDLFNPINLIPTPNNVWRSFKKMNAATKRLFPGHTLFEEFEKTSEQFSKVLSLDIPRMMQKIPESIDTIIHSLNTIRINGTEVARNTSIDLFSRLSKNLFVWSVLVAQTGVMATMSFGLMVRAGLMIFKSTPLPTELMKMQTALNELTLQLTKTLPLSVEILTTSLSNSTQNGQNMTINLNLLSKNIEDTNKAMDALQNQSYSLKGVMEHLATGSNVFDKQVYERFQNSLFELANSSIKIQEILPLLGSLVFNQNEYLVKFLRNLGSTFLSSGVGFSLPENIRELQGRFGQILNITQVMNFLNTSVPMGMGAPQLLKSLQSVFENLGKGFLTPGTSMMSKPLIRAIDDCIETINDLQKSNVLIPPMFLEPILALLRIMTKFIK